MSSPILTQENGGARETRNGPEYARLPLWLKQYLQDNFRRSASAWEMAMFLLDATISWRHTQCRDHRHRAQISLKEWLETGIRSPDRKRLLVGPVRISARQFWRIMQRWVADGIVFVESVGVPQETGNGPMRAWTPRQPNVYGFAQECCVHCRQKVAKDEPVQARRPPARTKRPAKVVEILIPQEKPAFPAAASAHTPRAREIGGLVQWYMAGGIYHAQYNREWRPEEKFYPDAAILARIVEAMGSAPVESLSKLMLSFWRSGKFPRENEFSPGSGPYNNAWWVTAIWRNIGKLYGAPTPSKFPARAQSASGAEEPAADRAAVNERPPTHAPPRPQPIHGMQPARDIARSLEDLL